MLAGRSPSVQPPFLTLLRYPPSVPDPRKTGYTRWRVRARIYRLYQELAELEHESQESRGSRSIQHALARLDDTEAKAKSLKVPQGYADLRYGLRLHINLVREELLRARQTRSAEKFPEA